MTTPGLSGKIALVTGAARGQGRSHALRLAREGADIIAIDVPGDIASVPYGMGTAADLAETVEGVEALDRRIVAVHADLRDEGAVQQAVDQGLAAFGKIDIVCANAGILSYAPCWELTSAQWNDTIGTNLNGVWHTIKAALPALMAGNGGNIVITSSMVGVKPGANALPYVAAKSALLGMTKALAIELGPKNIRVNAVAPTTVNTPMVTHQTTYDLFRPDLTNPTLDDCVESFAGLQALPIPWIETGDVSAAIAWLVSTEARYVTGICLPVDGGASIK